MAASKGKTRKEQAEETKNRIYNAAIELLDSRGFENLTIQCISRKANVSVGSFYHYFNSKLDILSEIFHRGDTYFIEVVKPGLEGKDTVNQILHFFDNYAIFNQKLTVEHAKAIYNPRIKLFTNTNRAMFTILEEIIEEGQKKGVIKNDETPRELAIFLYILCRGITFDWSLHDGQYDLLNKIDTYIKKVLPTILV